MRRIVAAVLSVLTIAVIAVLLLAPGCGNQCDRAEDCNVKEVCYSNVCTPVSSKYVMCQTNKDCGASGLFVCVATRCVLGDTINSNPNPDASVSDGSVSNDGAASDAKTDAGDVGGDGGGGGGDAVADAGASPDATADAGTNPSDTIAVTIGGTAIVFNPSGSSFDNTTGITTMNGTSGQQSIAITFPGNGLGNFACGTAGVSIQFIDRALNQTYQAAIGDVCQIIVNAYPVVGMQVKGTFSATLKSIMGNGPPTKSATGGNFAVTRVR